MSNPVKDALAATLEEVTHLPRFVHEIDGFIEHVRFDEVVGLLNKAELASQDVGSWQPIETAPKNGTEVLLWFPDWGRPAIGRWPRRNGRAKREGLWVFWPGAGPPCTRWEMPTYWQPLPCAPKEAEQIHWGKVKDQTAEALSTAHKVFAAEVDLLQAVIKRQVEAIDALQKRADKLVTSMEILAHNADEEALVAPDGWDVGNSPVSVDSFAMQALEEYHRGS